MRISYKDTHNECLTSQNSSSNMTPKLNLQIIKDPQEVLPSVELLLAQKQQIANLKEQEEKVEEIASMPTAELQSPQTAVKWPTKLAISFEQGLSPISGKSTQKKQLPRGVYLSKIVRQPLKTPKLNAEGDFSLMTRRLSCNYISGKKKQIAKSFFNNDIEPNEDYEDTSPQKQRKPSSKLELKTTIGKIVNLRSRKKSTESPTKNMCIDTQDFDEIVDSSCFDSYQHVMYPRDSKHFERFNYEENEGAIIGIIPSSRDYQDNFEAIKESQKPSTLSQNK